MRGGAGFTPDDTGTGAVVGPAAAVFDTSAFGTDIDSVADWIVTTADEACWTDAFEAFGEPTGSLLPLAYPRADPWFECTRAEPGFECPPERALNPPLSSPKRKACLFTICCRASCASALAGLGARSTAMRPGRKPSLIAAVSAASPGSPILFKLSPSSFSPSIFLLFSASANAMSPVLLMPFLLTNKRSKQAIAPAATASERDANLDLLSHCSAGSECEGENHHRIA